MLDQKYITVKCGKESVNTFDYQEYGILGIGKNRVPIKCMDQYINHDQDEELHIECCKGMSLAKNLQFGRTIGSFLPEEITSYNNINSWTEILRNIQEHDPLGVHQTVIKELFETLPSKEAQVAVFKYCNFALGAPIPWFFVLNLKNNDFWSKTQDIGTWDENIKYFPKLKEYVRTLPFKSVGRIVIFATYMNAPVLAHRDAVVKEHKDHAINLFFTGGDRKSYVYDEIKKTKIYLDPGARSYFINNRDYHGVDPEPKVRYTVRIDGTFEDWLCDELGLEDQYVWKWSYQNNN